MTFAIIHPDTVKAVGLRHLLRSYFDVATECFSTVAAFVASSPEQYDGYMVHPTMFVASMETLMPRKSRVVMLLDDDAVSAWSGLTLYTHRPLEEVIEMLDRCVSCIAHSNESAEVQEELTQREIEVLRGVARGLLNKEIADELHISINTVLSHRKNIVAKLGIKTVSGLSLYAVMNGIIDN